MRNVCLSEFVHNTKSTHVNDVVYELSSSLMTSYSSIYGERFIKEHLLFSHCVTFKFPLPLIECKTLRVFERSLIELESLIVDYSESE